MKLGVRIFLCYVFIFVVCFYYPFNWMSDNLRLRYMEGVEDPLVDQANILAGIVAQQMEEGTFDPDLLYRIFEERIYGDALAAQIYELKKINVDQRVYITDDFGKVLFDSMDKGNLGQDYSEWRDVRRTIAGEYGARTTTIDIDDTKTPVLHVAAPIRVRGEIAGVLTVAKPTTNINSFLAKARPKILRLSVLAIATAIGLSLLLSLWIASPINRLTAYADDVRKGKRVDLPRLDNTEVGKMGRAFEKMTTALAGKEYVEKYVQTLTHEIKSPLSAIRGAAELLEEDMPQHRRSQFLSNIRNEAKRVQQMVDRMLQLSSLENRMRLDSKDFMDLRPLIDRVLESKHPMMSRKELRLMVKMEDSLVVEGDTFLIRQALANLIQNAIDFTVKNGRVSINAHGAADRVVLEVENSGSSIPEYAEEKIFDKFFSLQRPDTGKKSTGLGLNFVKEVAELHGGGVSLENIPEGGVKATLTLARRQRESAKRDGDKSMFGPNGSRTDSSSGKK